MRPPSCARGLDLSFSGASPPGGTALLEMTADVGEYSSTSYTLDPDPSGTYRASGATDRLLGARASIRADL